MTITIMHTAERFDSSRHTTLDTEDVHYADVMLSMHQCKTIDELSAAEFR